MIPNIADDSSPSNAQHIPYSPPYNYTFNKTHIASPIDGVQMAISLSAPVPKHPDERFPVLFSYSPYRKDGFSWMFDWQVSK